VCSSDLSAIDALRSNFTQDVAGLDLELAAKNLDRCDSRELSADIVDRIFKNFCVGK
jgi:tRNA U34 5-carboxymethylaminomethyl modifying GTPase MnmE/TrmE